MLKLLRFRKKTKRRMPYKADRNKELYERYLEEMQDKRARKLEIYEKLGEEFNLKSNTVNHYIIRYKKSQA